jgi:hypothetical protein
LPFVLACGCFGGSSKVCKFGVESFACASEQGSSCSTAPPLDQSVVWPPKLIKSSAWSVLSYVYSLWFSKKTGGQCPDTTSWTASLIAWCTHAEIPSILTGVHCVCAHHGKELWELLLSLALLCVRHSATIGSYSASTGRVWVSAPPAATLVEAHVSRA